MINENQKHELMKLIAINLNLMDGDQYEIYKVFDLYATPEYINRMVEKYGKYFVHKLIESFENEHRSFFESQKFLEVVLTIQDSMVRWCRNTDGFAQFV